jgi:F-type H+-transporting ATPase subunit a
MQNEAAQALEHAAGAVVLAAAHGAEAHGAENDPIHRIHTGSWLHPLFTGDHPIINPKVFPEEMFISLVMAVLIAIGVILLTRGLTTGAPSKRQAALEMVYLSLRNLIGGVIGPDAPRYFPVIATVFLYILVLNLAGLIPGWKSPTSNINVTIAFALSVFVYVQYHGIRVNGFGGYLKHFWGEPAWLGPLNFPIHVIGELARPLSLSIRLFGNIFGEDLVLAILIFLMGFIPVQALIIPLAVFTSFVQALVFSILTSVYIATMVTHEGHEHEHEPAHGHEHGHGGVETPSTA